MDGISPEHSTFIHLEISEIMNWSWGKGKKSPPSMTSPQSWESRGSASRKGLQCFNHIVLKNLNQAGDRGRDGNGWGRLWRFWYYLRQHTITHWGNTIRDQNLCWPSSTARRARLTTEEDACFFAILLLTGPNTLRGLAHF